MPTPDLLAAFSRVALAHLPTPLEPLPSLSRLLGGPDVLVKRDDCTGVAFGGNKTRKLEFLLADAQDRSADVVITVGVVQSNHVRQTVAACARLGLECHVAVVDKVPGVDADYGDTGNVFLDRLMGAVLHPVPPGADPMAVVEEIATGLAGSGRRPYVIPYGGSNARGALGYVACAAELIEQTAAAGIRPAAVVHASGSAGTQGGLLAGFAAFGAYVPVIGIDIDGEPERVAADVAGVAAETLDLLGMAGREAPPVRVEGGYAGEGYGIPSPEMVQAVTAAARSEGLLLDPVYSGKAMAGLTDLISRGEFAVDDTVVFIHTGGTPALFAYRSAFAGA